MPTHVLLHMDPHDARHLVSMLAFHECMVSSGIGVVTPPWIASLHRVETLLYCGVHPKVVQYVVALLLPYEALGYRS